MTRRAFDFYPTTDAGATRGLLDRAPVAFTGVALECCSGEHHMTRVLEACGRFSQVLTNDVVPSREAIYHEDAREERVWRDVFPAVDWVITNPPFGEGIAILKMAVKFARIGVAFYLRLTFWEPTTKDRDMSKRRGRWLEANPPNGFIPTSRISFTDDGGTDSTTGAWYVWVRGSDQQWHFVLILDEDEPAQTMSLLDAPPGESGIELHGPEALSAISKAYTRVCK